MAAKKKVSRKKATKKKAKKKVTKKKVTKKKAKKKATKKKATKKNAKKKVTKKKATKKKAKKKATKKKATKKNAKKKVTKKKATKKKAKKKVTKKKAKKKATKKKATKKKAMKKATKKKTTKATAKKKVVKKKPAVKATAPKAAETKAPVELKVYTPKVVLGEKVPEFSLPATGGKTVSSSDLNGQTTVIYFYPKDHTPGCTIQGHDFTNLKAAFADNNTVVYGVSRDSIKSHEKFVEKQNYAIELISDSEEELCAIFGAIKLKNMYGRKVRGIDRSTFIIDENGNLVKEWRSVKVTDHAQEVLDYIKNK